MAHKTYGGPPGINTPVRKAGKSRNPYSKVAEYRALAEGFKFFNVALRKKALGMGFASYTIEHPGHPPQPITLPEAHSTLNRLWDKFGGKA